LACVAAVFVFTWKGVGIGILVAASALTASPARQSNTNDGGLVSELLLTVVPIASEPRCGRQHPDEPGVHDRKVDLPRHRLLGRGVAGEPGRRSDLRVARPNSVAEMKTNSRMNSDALDWASDQATPGQ
jgi:hypothetical protein